MKVTLRFKELRRWGGSDFDVDLPRVPVQGDLVQGPDDFGVWRAREVIFAFDDGMAFDPKVLVVLEPV
jgi:hypothetical protein